MQAVKIDHKTYIEIPASKDPVKAKADYIQALEDNQPSGPKGTRRLKL